MDNSGEWMRICREKWEERKKREKDKWIIENF